MPFFVVMDNAPKFRRWVLLALARVWPEFMLVDPSQATLTDTHLAKEGQFTDAVLIASDPPHRIWRMQRVVRSMHPDFFFLVKEFFSYDLKSMQNTFVLLSSFSYRLFSNSGTFFVV